MKDKVRLLLLYGGRSAEHEISILSAASIYQALDKTRYEVLCVGVARDGELWLNPDQLAGIAPGSMELQEVPKTGQRVYLASPPPHLRTEEGRVLPIDVVFPILHGPFGEDGSLQGMLRFFDVPFVGPGVFGSAAAMDKGFAKILLREAGVEVARGKVFGNESQMLSACEDLVADYGWPLFVKPANMGSSVGVSRATNANEFAVAVREAFRYDHRVLVEQAITGREIECAVLGNQTVEVSVPGEVLPKEAFYSYQAKYVDPDGAGIVIPAQLDADTVARIQAVVERAYRALGCEGLSRVDVFLEAGGRVVVNEINTLPGFTRISMYPALMAAGGTSFGTLVDRLVELAFERHRRDSALQVKPN